ncbi:hypothetical protein UFOVP777_23 [uncultured Caudovirales phage]|uniref:Collagen triple helix repeat n=1 Tax=uncultured Caudovirales phage TaxID=2100421 RepID=A0A6J5NQT4_9CAUD|nr:hypothetical protein UFOVP777_23 [uncultured Caudovirales phage]
MNQHPIMVEAPEPIVLAKDTFLKLEDGKYVLSTEALPVGPAGPQGISGMIGPKGDRGSVGPAGNVTVIEKFVLAFQMPRTTVVVDRPSAKHIVTAVSEPEPFKLPTAYPVTEFDLVKCHDPFVARNRERIRWMIVRLRQLEQDLKGVKTEWEKRFLRGQAYDQLHYLAAQLR